MLDINFVIKNKKILEYSAKEKGIQFDFDEFIKVYEDQKELLNKINQLREKKNKLSKAINKEEIQENIEIGKSIRNDIKTLEDSYRQLKITYIHYSYRIPNIFLEDTPIGKSDKDNKEVKKWGDIPKFSFQPKTILELGDDLDMIDIPKGVKTSGTKNYFLKGELIFLEQAIFQFTLDFLKKEGFKLYSVPLMVKKDALYGTGYFPGAEEETYFLNNDDLYLIGTSEVSMCAYYKDDILTENFPIKMCALSNCFRREAGTYGKIDQGLYRVHQFQKVEQVIFCQNDPKISEELHYYLLENSEKILQALELPYRVVRVCSGDLGFGQVLKHDIETWMPSKQNYAETHSCSSFYDFQTRRLNVRYFNSKTKKNEYPYSLNNTAIASPRILIPILENNQQEDGKILIPTVLQSYMKRKYL